MTKLITRLGFLCLVTAPCLAQEVSERANMNSSIANDGTGSIIVEAHGKLPEPTVFYTARAEATAQVASGQIEQTVELTIKVIQGNAKTLTFGLSGDGEVVDCQGEEIRSWAVRQAGSERFLDLHVGDNTTEIQAKVTIRSAEVNLPATVELAHLSPAQSVGFDSIVSINYSAQVEGRVEVATGFVPLDSGGRTNRFQTTTGGQIKLSLRHNGAAPTAVEMFDTSLKGSLHPNEKSIHFQLRSSVLVTQPKSEVTVLSGNAAVSELPIDDHYRLQLATENDQPVYKLVFDEVGTYPLTLDFVAALNTDEPSGQSIDFTISAAAIVPLELSGFDKELDFSDDLESIAPVYRDDVWLGFLPATGRAKMQWKPTRKSSDGKLFFTTSGRIEASVGTGLLRQDHQIDYQVLQGELKSLSIQLHGPGEIIDVQSTHLVGWEVSGTDEDRQLNITLSQAVASECRVTVRSQTPLGAFPVRVEGLRLSPLGAIRHWGFLRLSNSGLVRLEPIDLSGLTQLSPQQFPGEPVDARQVFVYRFPSAAHSFSVDADRIAAEINVSELVLYELSETDRVIKADIELDIREAPIRQWDFEIPSDYSVVSVTGASVADSIAASDTADGLRNLQVIFAKDVSGRQLVALHLEKSEAAASATDWILPRIEFPTAKTVRGEIGVVASPGFRIAVAETDMLVEKTLSYFPKPAPHLQQAFRIREPHWSATMHVERLDRSVQADMFHLYSLSAEAVYGSSLINYFVTGSPVSQWKITVPQTLGNVMVDGMDVRTWHREGDTLIVSLPQPVMGAYTLLVSYEEKPDKENGSFRAGQVVPLGVQGERGYIQVVSPMQVRMKTVSISDWLLKLDPLELPAELRLLSTAPALGTWQYTERSFDLALEIEWFEPGSTVPQIVEFSEANSRVSQDGESVTDVIYYIKSRGENSFKVKLPGAPVRLWEVSVNGQAVTARQADDATLIPLPGVNDPNLPVEVRLRFGKPTVRASRPELALPIVFAPVLKTQWNVSGDEKHVLVPTAATVMPATPVLRPSGFYWIAKQGLLSLLIIGLCSSIGIWGSSKTGGFRAIGLVGVAIAIWVCLSTAITAFSQAGGPSPLQLDLPILSAGETVALNVKNMPLWEASLSWFGLLVFVGGIAVIAWSFAKDDIDRRIFILSGGILLLVLGVLFQADSAAWFYGLLALALFLFVFIPSAWESVRRISTWFRRQSEQRKRKPADASNEGTGTILSAMLLFISVFSSAIAAVADESGFEAAGSIKQQWQVTHQDARLIASGTITLTGQPGDRFVLLKAPAVLTHFATEGLRLTKTDVGGQDLTYIVSIPINEDGPPPSETPQNHTATFEYQLDAVTPSDGIPLLTGTAALQEIDLRYDEAGFDVTSPRAIRIEPDDAVETTHAKVLLGPGGTSLFLKPKARDVRSEPTQFFVEASNLYLPGPGVVDGRHRLHIRTSQGQVSELSVLIPTGLTVRSVNGPVGFWQFDADSGKLSLSIEPAQSQEFDVVIETQRGLDPLPTDVSLAPLRVAEANGEVGLLAVAFGPDAQPEKMEAKQMSEVNLGDFDLSMVINDQAVLHRVYRYGAAGGQLTTRVAPVDSEVRVTSKQVLSFGDERVVMGIDFSVDISRSGLFQLSFPLPNGLEIESFSGDSLHHWSERIEGDRRQIVMHLNGKTIGTQTFALSLSGTASTSLSEWEVPHFALQEATRQSGELIIRPTTGIRLRTLARQNVSEMDSRELGVREMGSQPQGSLAFQLLQRDWNLVLEIEKLDPWITGQVLHEVTLREGQTRSVLIADFDVQNASVRSLQVTLPITNEDEIKTLRAVGESVSDLIRTDADSNTWEVQFKRRIVGNVQFRIEYERRGERENGDEKLSPAGFPETRQLAYYFAVRAGGRLELEHDPLLSPWQRVDWNSVPAPLRNAENRSAPAFALRTAASANELVIHAKRHSIADALKLHVAKGTLTTVLSPTADQLTSVDLTIEVIQRSSLSVGLPEGGKLLSIFVNGESVNSIRLAENRNVWQFYILPGIDDSTANVRFVYSVAGDRLRQLTLCSPELNLPLENILWNVIAPKGFELTDNDGNLELVSRSNEADYNRKSYLAKSSDKRQIQVRAASELLDQANELLQAGEQTKARWALSSVANQNALDAASNEDARVQLENLQTQQAIAGLNTRRQRLFLDNHRNDLALADNQQLREAATANPILQQNQLNFQPQQLSQLLGGNTTADNAMLTQIAGRLVQHQHTTEPAPQAILISLPEEGTVYQFGRSVQVTENSALKLELEFDLQRRVPSWRIATLIALLVALAITLASIAGANKWRFFA